VAQGYFHKICVQAESNKDREKNYSVDIYNRSENAEEDMSN
jgi:hypothetical protein